MQSPAQLTDLSLIKPLGKDILNQWKCSLCPRADSAGFWPTTLVNASYRARRNTFGRCCIGKRIQRLTYA